MATEALSPVQPDKFQPLRDAYRAALPQRMGEICRAWARFERDGWTAAHGHEFERLVHTLAGSAGTFGLHALGDQARVLEDFLNADGVWSARQTEVERYLARLQSLAATATGRAPGD